MKSDRFDRKGASRKQRHGGRLAITLSPIPLNSMPFEDVRLYQNLDAAPFGFETETDVLQWLCAMAAESPAARYLLTEAMADDWSVQLADLGGNGYALENETRCLTLDHAGFTPVSLGKSPHYRNALFVDFIGALRQIWHDRQNHDFTKSHRPDAVLMLERARAADCAAIIILVGWELRGAGHADIWRWILGSDNGDMAMIFTRAIEKDPAGFYDGSVLTRAFCQWYGDEGRVAAQDHDTLGEMDTAMAIGPAPVFGKNRLDAITLEKLSRLPGGRYYLQGMGQNLITDPYFVSMNDPINESHLFQIIYDSKVVMVEGVPFRDRELARLIFPTRSVRVRD